MDMDPSAWTDGVSVHTPLTMTTDERDSFFQLVPPTPHDPALPLTSPDTNTTSPNSQYEPTPHHHQRHLRPMASDTSLALSLSERSHRSSSTSSFDSASASASVYGGVGGGWSTIASSDTHSDIDFDFDLDLDFGEADHLHVHQTLTKQQESGEGLDLPTSFFGSSSSAHTTAQSSNSSSTNNLATRPHSRVPSLSIDPRLFAPRDAVPSHSHDEDADGEGDDGEGEEMVVQTAKPGIVNGTSSLATPHTARPQPARPARARARADTKKGEDGSPVAVSPKKKEKGGDKKKISHARKTTADHIPRPRNAFILFRKHVVDAKLIPSSVEMRHQNVSIITAKMWSEAPPDQKAHFNELARVEKEEHMKKYPGYRYQPVYRRTNVIRRRVRKDEAEEEKCRSVAELLIKGKSGDALEEEIKEKIRQGSEVDSSSSKSRSTSRRGSTACGLSKGALRALRAQARSVSVSASASAQSEWSDFSRATSMDVDLPPSASIGASASDLTASERIGSQVGVTATRDDSHTHSHSHSQILSTQFRPIAHAHAQLANEQTSMSIADSSPPPLEAGLGLPGFTMGHIQPHATGSGQWGEAIAYAHPDLTNWSFTQPQPQPQSQPQLHHLLHSHSQGQPDIYDYAPGQQQQQHEQKYTYPSDQLFQPHYAQMDSIASAFTSATGSSSSHQFYPSDASGSGSNFLYPQPMAPGAASVSSLQTEQFGSQAGMLQSSFYTYDAALPFSPSASAQGFNFQNDATGTTGVTGANAALHPMSARWDRSQFLPPASEVPLENLFFDESADAENGMGISMGMGESERGLVFAEDGAW